MTHDAQTPGRIDGSNPRFLVRVCSRLGALFIALCGRRSLLVALFMLSTFLGLLWLVASAALGIGSLTVNGKEVGFLLSLNWSLNYLIVLPLLLLAFPILVQLSVKALGRMLENRMLVTVHQGTGVVFSDRAVLLALYSKFVGFAVLIALTMSLIGTIYSIHEWLYASAIPLFKCEAVAACPELKIGESEADWSVGTLIDPSVDRYGNAAFSFLVFLLGQSVIVAVGLFFVCYTTCFAIFLLHIGITGAVAAGQPQLIPSVLSEDPRRGFEHLEGFGLTAMLMGTLFYVAVYLSATQNIYLRVDAGATSIFGFLFGILDSRMFEHLIPIGRSTVGPLVLPLVVLVCSGVIPLLLLQLTAISARERARDYRATLVGWMGLTVNELDALAQKVEGMKVWPYSWLTLNKFVAFLLAGMVGLLYFRLLPYMFVILAIFTVPVLVYEVPKALGRIFEGIDIVKTANRRDNVDFLIVTPLAEECDAVRQHIPCDLVPASNEDVRVYYRGEFAGYTLALLPLFAMGTTAAATATADAIRRWRPRYVVLVGIAGGVEDRSVSLGDVLVADRVVDYELQKVRDDGREYRWQPKQVDPRLLYRSQALEERKWYERCKVERPQPAGIEQHPSVRKGVVATGNKVVMSAALLAELREGWRELIGIEMEAGGVAQACFESATQPGFFMIRGVSDLADSRKDGADVVAWRKYACDVPAAYLAQLLWEQPVERLQVR